MARNQRLPETFDLAVKERTEGLETLFLARTFVSNSFLLLVVRPGAPSSVLAPSSDARSP